MLSAVSLCADKRITPSYSGDLYGRKNKFFINQTYATFHFVRPHILRMISYICVGECTL